MSKGRILVIDSDEDIRMMCKIFFTGQGYDVDVASTGAEGLETTRQKLPSIILLDIALPDINTFAKM